MKRELSPYEITSIQNTAAQMDEKQRRQFYYHKAQELGYGGISYIARTFHVSKMTLIKAEKELAGNDAWKRGDRNRKAGGGRKKSSEQIKDLKAAVLEIVDPAASKLPDRQGTSVLYYAYFCGYCTCCQCSIQTEIRLLRCLVRASARQNFDGDMVP